MEANKGFKEFEGIIEQLLYLSEKLTGVIDKQIDAVVSPEQGNIDQHVEEYTNLRGDFKEQEHLFIDHLQMLLHSADMGDVEIRIEKLKEAYPPWKQKVDAWRQKLEKKMSYLKKRHVKLNELLEFAVDRNMKLMHSIYSLHNQKNTRYGSSGDKEEISSGIALNKEA